MNNNDLLMMTRAIVMIADEKLYSKIMRSNMSNKNTLKTVTLLMRRAAEKRRNVFESGQVNVFSNTQT